MKKFKLIVPSFVALIFCMLLIAGSTFALFTSQASASISATSGKVKVTANLEDLELYSADASLTEGDLAGTITDGDFAGTYYFKEQTGTFANGGTAALSTDGKSLVLEKMTPGDKVELALNLGNESNVNIKYRLKVTTSYKIGTREYDQALASALKFTFGTTTKNGLVAYQSNWIELAAGSAQPSALPIVIEFPLEKGNEFQDGGVVYNFLVEAVQGNAATSGSELFDTVELLMPNKSASKEAENEVPIVLKVEDNNKTMVEVRVPAIAVAENETKEVELKVSDLFVQKSESTADSKVSMKIDLTINDVAATAADLGNEAVTAIVFVGTGLSNIEVVHNPGLENEVKLTAVNSLEELDEVNKSYYDAETGYVTFKTNSFSPFSFTGDFAAALTVDNNTILYATLKDALDAANAVTSGSITIDLFKDDELKSGYNGTRYEIKKDMTINGNNHKVEVINYGFGIFTRNVTFNDLTIENSSSNARCIDTRAKETDPVESLTLDNVKLISKSTSGYDQPLTIGGNSSTPINLTIKNSTIKANKYYAIMVYNPINASIINSTIEGWACIYLKGANSSQGSAGSVINVSGSRIISANPYSGSSNAFAAVQFEDMQDTNNPTQVNISNSIINIAAYGNEYQGLIAFALKFTDTTYTVVENTAKGIAILTNNTYNLTGEKAVVAYNCATPVEEADTITITHKQLSE